ncbi:MAG: rRNA maturation RNase YbeY [Treponemataceae bacterium]|jgi:probable rRNA maturation factor|nr:rRNA maturation RNase YbeY [Treponemataceae bacterium]
MKNKITVLNEETFSSGYSQKKLESVEIFIQDVLNHLNFENWEMNVVFCDDKFMQEMNLQYRNIDAPTDVLSFEQGDYYIDDDENEIFSAGDILISDETLSKNAKEFNIAKNDELKRLLVHGILHLSGEDHGEFHVGINGDILDGNSNVVEVSESLKNEEIEMLVLQEKILKELSDKKILED